MQNITIGMAKPVGGIDSLQLPVFGLALLAVPLALKTRLPRAAIPALLLSPAASRCGRVIYPSWVNLFQNGRAQDRFVLLSGCLRSTEYFVLGQRLQNIWLWATTGKTALTCDGQPTGNPPISLLPLLPLKTVSAQARLLAKGCWLLLFSTMLVCVWKIVRPAALAAGK